MKTGLSIFHAVLAILAIGMVGSLLAERRSQSRL